MSGSPSSRLSEPSAKRGGSVEVVVPGQREQRLVSGVGRAGVQLLQPLAEVVDEPGVGAAVVGRVEGLVVPLQQPLRVGQGAVFLRGGRRGDEEDLGLDVGRRRAVRVVLPEDGALRLEPVERRPASRGCAGRRGAAWRWARRRRGSGRTGSSPSSRRGPCGRRSPAANSRRRCAAARRSGSRCRPWRRRRTTP